jgi:hypothetical protein
LGAFWYSPVLFGPSWCKLAGVAEAEMKAGLAKALIPDVIGSALMAFVLLHAVHYAGAHNWAQGGAVGFFNWLGFVAVATLGSVTFEKRPLKLYLINKRLSVSRAAPHGRGPGDLAITTASFFENVI